jgi:hypothetical protein
MYKQYTAKLLPFTNIGVLESTLPGDIFQLLKTSIDNLTEDAETYNTRLVGHIREEYSLDHINNVMSGYIIGVANAWSDAHPGYIAGFEEAHKNKNYELQLTSLWVNKQKKYEFNPLHTHPSVLSFVIWVKIPYRLEDEINYFPQVSGKDSSKGNVHTSKFCFVYIDTLGSIKQVPIPVDSSYEGTIMMFPSTLNHIVYPFYTSDEYRISVSGNIRINVLEKSKES